MKHYWQITSSPKFGRRYNISNTKDIVAQAMSKEDAELIVQAVNSFPKLLEALKMYVDADSIMQASRSEAQQHNGRLLKAIEALKQATE